jgi:hypothetical protein
MAEAQGKLSGRPASASSPAARARAMRRSASHRLPGLDAADRFHRPGGERAARPRGLPGGRLTGRCSARHARLRQVGGRGAGRPIGCPSTWRAPSTPAMQGRPGPVVLALPEDMLRVVTAAPVLPRVEPALAAPAPEALASLGSAARRRRAAVRHRRRQRLDGRGVRGARALRRELAASGRLRVPLPGRLRQPPSELRRRRRHRHQSEARRAHRRRRPRCSRSARGWAR